MEGPNIPAVAELEFGKRKSEYVDEVYIADGNTWHIEMLSKIVADYR